MPHLLELVYSASGDGVRDSDGILIPLRLTQSDLGSRVGLARETVDIVLQDFRQRKLVEADRQSIRITDPDRLRTVSPGPRDRPPLTASSPPPADRSAAGPGRG